ncbi:MAG: benzoyl-CoA reductase subunit A [Deltaproteobacteria bacterium]|nr:benzoyl-CoA reductase subunit A [Deltaproteobacteria bacterium]
MSAASAAAAPDRNVECVIGVDLGSTTSKAVVLDLEGRILGRGITNSRSSYDRAVEVARTEALTAARFALLRREVEAKAGTAALKLLLDAFRLQQHLLQLLRLKALIDLEIPKLGPTAPGAKLGEAVAVIFDRVRGEEEARYAATAKGEAPAGERSDFFRDAAGSAYTRLAEELAPTFGLDFDVLQGLFDKCIIAVENAPLELGFVDHIDGALHRVGDQPELRAGVEAAVQTKFVDRTTVGTGYGRARLPFPKEQIRSEILCHGLGAHAMFPTTRTVLDIGGQDTKAIQVDAAGIVTSFQMNDRCAAGCGRYLGYIADEMNVGLHELGPLAEKSQKFVKINSTCTVFAGAELRERLSLGEKREDILAGLHRAIMLRAMSLLARSGGVVDALTFTGGVAKNPAAVKALRALVTESYGARSINISPESIYTGALGAAIFAQRLVRS